MEARLDKWLWAARIFKTRSIAADACKNGRVTIGGVKQKASKMVCPLVGLSSMPTTMVGPGA